MKPIEEEIIIDEKVCGAYDEGKCYADDFDTQDIYCENNPDCYYKQLKRKEAECEKLKEQYSNVSSLIWYIYCGSEDNLAEHIIGEYYNCLNDIDERYIKNFWKKIRNLEQTEGRIKINKYKQALEEIREIASAIINGRHITNDIEGHLKELSKSIIEKINEVLK